MRIKLAMLSNVNMDYAARLLEDEFQVYCNEGYGDIFGALTDADSSLNRFDPQAIIILVDVEELLSSCTGGQQMQEMERWFGMFEDTRRGDREYLISDAWQCRISMEDMDEFAADSRRGIWQELLRRSCRHANVHRLSLDALNGMGLDKCFSHKLWYLGKMPFSVAGYGAVADTIRGSMRALYHQRRKVLAVDLDNTLWGGILGECGPFGIALSEEGVGGIYRDVQKLLLRMKQRGVLLVACSKNNERDVEEVFSSHPHMVLQRGDFVSLYINWNEKSDNLCAIAQELKLGLDSFVFIDDSPSERAAVRMRLPMVCVPEFPSEVERIPAFFGRVYCENFRKPRPVAEDQEKTRQYADHFNRESLKKQMMDYDSYLASLELKAERVEFSERVEERLLQLLRKTNQFNLTVRRYDRRMLEQRLAEGFLIYAFRASDRFGDYGIIALILVEPKMPLIDVFLMSCRAMGKRLETYFLHVVEEDLIRRGYRELWAEYVPSPQNMPVSGWYDKMGYGLVRQETGKKVYKIDLSGRRQRRLYVNKGE